MSCSKHLITLIALGIMSVSVASRSEASMVTYIYNSGDDLVIDQYGSLDVSNARYEKRGRFSNTYMRAESFNTAFEVQSHVGGYDWAYFHFGIESESDLSFTNVLGNALGPTRGGTVLGNGGIGYFLNNENNVEGWKAHTFYLPSTYDGGELRVKGIAEGGAVPGLQASSGSIDLGSETLDIFIGTSPSGLPDISQFNSNEYANDISSVPLPAALPLLLAGLIGLGLVGRRRKVVAG